MRYLPIGMLLSCYFLPLLSYSQDATTSVSDKVTGFSTAFYTRIQDKTTDLDRQLTRQTTKYLDRLSRMESRLLSGMRKTDTGVNNRLPPPSYQQWIKRVQDTSAKLPVTGQCYIPHLDTLQTTLKFLQNQQGASSVGSNTSNQSLLQAGTQVQQLQAHLDQSTQISQYISQRKQQLTQLLEQYTQLPSEVTKAFNQYKETGYYYRQQVEEYKKILNDPQKIEEKAVTMLNKLPAYQQFLTKHSLLASLFPLPADNSSNSSLQGLQTRDQVQQILQQQVSGGGAGGQAAVDQQMSQAQSQLSSMQTNLSKYGVGGQDLDMPDFKPDQQKTKTLLGRLTYGFNLQLAKSSTYYPATGNLGLSLGYKINDKSTVGIGASYNIGLGSGWRHMQFSSQGIGLRSYMDWKIKNTYYIIGGYEENYLTSFNSIAQLQNRSAWQASALVGLEKKYKISSKLQGNIQLLYDALYRQEVPAGQMFKFRLGYNF